MSREEDSACVAIAAGDSAPVAPTVQLDGGDVLDFSEDLRQRSQFGQRRCSMLLLHEVLKEWHCSCYRTEVEAFE